MNPIDTPITNHSKFKSMGPCGWETDVPVEVVPVGVSEQLERDLNAQIEANKLLECGVRQTIPRKP